MLDGRGALFLDFGGTLAVVEGGRTVVDVDGNPVLLPHVEEVLPRVRPGFHGCFLVSNQARIARREITEVEVLRRLGWLNQRLGGLFTDWRICPHGDGDGCRCRKPRPGMFLDLAATYRVDLAASTHVGDSEKDRDAARAAGVGTFVWAGDFFETSAHGPTRGHRAGPRFGL